MYLLKNYYKEIILFVLCLVNLFTGILPQAFLLLVIILAALKDLSFSCWPFICLLWLKDVMYAFFFLNYHISGFGQLTYLLGFVMSLAFIKNNLRRIAYNGGRMWIVLLILFTSMMMAGNYANDSDKMSVAVIDSITYLIAFSYVFSKRNKVNSFALALYSCIFAVFLLQLNTIKNGYGTPSSIMDFGFYRSAVGEDMYKELAQGGVKYATHYQFFGTMVTFGVSLAFATTNLKKSELLLLMAMTILAVGYTGARQYLIILTAIFLLYIILQKSSWFFKGTMIIIGSMIVSYMVYQSVINDYMSVIFDEGIFAGSGREGVVDEGIELFKSNPLFGVGFCGYKYFGSHQVYPHNMIVEMLSELGLIGTILIFFVVLFKNENLRYLYSTHLNFYGFYIILSLFARSMISLNLGQNIAMAGVICALGFASSRSNLSTFRNNIKNHNLFL